MTPNKNEIWRHYKYDPKGEEGNYTYEIVGTSVHTETEEILVVYTPLYQSDFLEETGVNYFCRPLAMWNDHIEKENYTGPRFTKIK